MDLNLVLGCKVSLILFKFSQKGSRFGLGYIPIADDKIEALGKKMVDWELAKLAPLLYQSFPVQEYDNDVGLRQGIGNLYEESNALLEVMIETSGILDAKPEERVHNWTSTKLLVPHSSR